MIQIDMPMPKTCGECRFADYTTREYPYCTALQQDRGYPFDVNKKKFPNCPLKQEDKTETQMLREALEEKNGALRVMFNRCVAVGSGGGALCIFCGLKNECEQRRSAGKGEG